MRAPSGPAGLIRSGYLLTANSLITSGLGFLFWLVAARQVDPDAFGLTTALISALTVLSGIGCVGLISALPRFIPVTPAWRLLVVRSYVVATVATGALTVLGGLWLRETVDDFRALADPALFALLVASAVTWTLFSLQDFVLIARQRPTVVVLENVAAGVARIALLFTPAVGTEAEDLLVVWLAPTVIAVVAVNGFVLSGDSTGHGSRARDVGVAGIIRYSAVSA